MFGKYGHYLKMTSSNRIERLIDPSTWNPMDEDMVFADPTKFHSSEEPYKIRIESAKKKRIRLTDAIQTGISQLNSIPVVPEVIDLQRARLQEGSLSLMQMAKISSVLCDYQSSKKLFYISILTSRSDYVDYHVLVTSLHYFGVVFHITYIKATSLLCDVLTKVFHI
ncbi:hypothetical protein Bca4012_018551 [Brassica carinata]|uniref:Uncharacterized protein n=1 Tax=Brassica carinata TaxID=52824 RepID=A0A8X7WKF0_BRACI|nr:hypothetical protein Bca52824_003056 [Brassica carinata]